MAARLVMVFVPDKDAEAALTLARRHARRIWIRPAVGEMESLLCVVQGRYVERLLDELEDAFGDLQGRHSARPPKRLDRSTRPPGPRRGSRPSSPGTG